MGASCTELGKIRRRAMRLKIPPSQERNPHRRKCKLMTQRKASGILTGRPDETRRHLKRISHRDNAEGKVHREGRDSWDSRNSGYTGKAGTLHG